MRVVNAGVATSAAGRGRPGYAYLGVPGSGAVDRRSADLVNRLVGNPPEAAVLETAGGLVLEVIAPVVVADSTTGAVQSVLPGETDLREPGAGGAVGVPRRPRWLRGRARARLAELGQPVEARPATARARRSPECRRRSAPTRRDGPGATPSVRANTRAPPEPGTPGRLVRARRLRRADHRGLDRDLNLQGRRAARAASGSFAPTPPSYPAKA